jgi:hypothetical protein
VTSGLGEGTYYWIQSPLIGEDSKPAATVIQTSSFDQVVREKETDVFWM